MLHERGKRILLKWCSTNDFMHYLLLSCTDFSVYDCIIVDCLCPITLNYFFIYFSHYNDLWTLTIYILQHGEHIFPSWNRLITLLQEHIFNKIQQKKQCNTNFLKNRLEMKFQLHNQKVLILDQKLKADSLKLFFPILIFSFYFWLRQNRRKKWELKTFKINFERF